MANIRKAAVMGMNIPFNPGRAMRKSGQTVIFPFYHTVSDTPEPWIRNLYGQKTVKEFERDLDWLCLHFKPLSIGDFLSGRAGDKKEAMMVLSFDDGLLSCNDIIAPILKKKGIPALFFINNNFVGNRDLFYRYKASILIEHLKENASPALQKEALQILNCENKNLLKSILSLGYTQQEKLSQLATLYGFTFEDYLKENPVYLDEEQIRQLMHSGFDIGAHSEDHPFFRDLQPSEMVDRVKRSVDRLIQEFSPGKRYFAFPFTDAGVPQTVISDLFEKEIIDAGFGTAGMKKAGPGNYFQRIPMEIDAFSAKQIIGGEFHYFRIKRLFGLNS